MKQFNNLTTETAMDEDKKRQLSALKPEELADALLKLAGRAPRGMQFIDQILATPIERLKALRARIADLEQFDGYVSWSESPDFADGLEELLDDIRRAELKPEDGLLLIRDFFRLDAKLIETCDDSSGSLGTVFYGSGVDRFSEFAAECQDRKLVVTTLIDLLKGDEYSIRSDILDKAARFLSEEEIRDLLNHLLNQARNEAGPDDFQRRQKYSNAERVAVALGDPDILVSLKEERGGNLNSSDLFQIAEKLHDSGRAEEALEWLDRVGEDEYMPHDVETLKLGIYESLGRTEDAAKLAYRMFQSFPTMESFKKYLRFAPGLELHEALNRELERIRRDERLRPQEIKFLFDADFQKEAAEEILRKKNQLNGDHYGSLMDLAERFDSARIWIAASALYRALLDSILKRAQSRAYHYGALYLRRLDEIAANITEWKPITPHSTYVEELRSKHYRKRSFWQRYEQERKT